MGNGRTNAPMRMTRLELARLSLDLLLVLELSVGVVGVVGNALLLLGGPLS